VAEVNRIIMRRNQIKISTKRLVIYCLGSKGYVGLNRIGMKMEGGVNVVCLCNLHTLHNDLEVFLTPGPGMTLIECSNNMINTQTFIMMTHIHTSHCPAKIFPTLKELSYFGMIRAGYFGDTLERMENNGQIPKCVMKEAPKLTYHEIDMYLTDFVPIWHPYVFHYTRACTDPDNHMKSFLLGSPI
jgi:hypothetical protein